MPVVQRHKGMGQRRDKRLLDVRAQKVAGDPGHEKGSAGVGFLRQPALSWVPRVP